MIDYISQLKNQLASSKPLYIRVRVASKCPKTEIVDRMDDGTYKIKVAAVPIKGAANAELIKFLRKSLGASEVAIISGGRDKVKLIKVKK